MSERIEHLELDLEAKDKRLDDLQEALKSESRQCGDLSFKLETTQKKLEQTQDALADTKERLRQAQYFIKEQDFVISKFQQSEDALVEQARSLRTELEGSVNDISGLHLKIDRKNTVEMNNHNIVQTFHGDLVQHLKALHSSVTASLEQQQQQIQKMEQQTKSFLATKNEMMEALRERVSSIKHIFGFGLKRFQDLVHSHEKDSTSIFEKLNTTISAHGFALEQLLSISVMEAEDVLQGLLKALFKQQDAISSSFCQQQEKAQQSIEASREISKAVVNFYELLEINAAEIHKGVLDSHKGILRNLTELEETYEKQSKQEEHIIMEKIADMVAAANARKSEIVNSKIRFLRESSIKDSIQLQRGLVKVHEATSESQRQWQSYMKQAESHFCEASDSLPTEQRFLEESVGHWEGIYGNGLLLSNHEQLDDSIQSDVQAGGGVVFESIESSINTDKDATAIMLSTGTSQSYALTKLQIYHSTGTEAIQIQADRYLSLEYLEDKPTCTTPRKRLIDVPNQVAIEELRAPCIENLVQEFRETNNYSTFSEKGIASQRSMAVKESKLPIFAESSLLKDNRVPLTTVN